MSWHGRGGVDLASYHTHLGLQLQAEGDLDGALRHYGRAAEENPNFPGLHRQRGWLHYQRGDFEKALRDLDFEIDLDPGDLQSYECRARVRLALEDFEGALKDYTWLVARSPDQPRIHGLRAVAYAQRGNLERALDESGFAVELDSRNPEPYVTRGWVRWWRGEPDLAAEDVRRALTLDRRNVGASQLQGRLLLAEGKLQEARECFGRAIKGGWPELSAGVVLIVEGRLDEARARFERSISACWNNPGLRDTGVYLLWLCRRSLGERDADPAFRSAMRRPRPRPADWAGCIAAYVLGDRSEAELWAAARSGQRGEREGQAAFHVGIRRKFTGDSEGAVRSFEQCVTSRATATYEWVLAKAELAGL